MSDHWGGFDHHDDDGLPDFSDIHDMPETHELPDVPDHVEHEPDLHTELEHHDISEISELHDVHDPLPEPEADFPPALEVGDLPEPVDGFPWIDASTLGTADTYTAPVETIDGHDLAAYAGIEVPDGSDPWTVLSASDDPAVAALARWWTPGEQ